MQKYKFSVCLQQNKHKVDVQIYGVDIQDAERRLRKMYPNGEVTQSTEAVQSKIYSPSLDINKALSIIAEEC